MKATALIWKLMCLIFKHGNKHIRTGNNAYVPEEADQVRFRSSRDWHPRIDDCFVIGIESDFDDD